MVGESLSYDIGYSQPFIGEKLTSDFKDVAMFKSITSIW